MFDAVAWVVVLAMQISGLLQQCQTLGSQHLAH
jgi:hypothetical protein